MNRWRARLRSALQVWRHHRVQALLSVLGVVAGVSGLVTVVAIGEGARREFNEAIGLLGGGTLVVRSSGTPIEPERIAAVQRILGPELDQLVPVANGQTAIQSSLARVEGIRVVQTGRDYQRTQRLELFDGRFISWYDQDQHTRVCVLGWELGRALFPRGGAVGNQVRLGNEIFTVVGWLAPTVHPEFDFGGAELPDLDQVAYVPLVNNGPTASGASLDELILRFDDEADLMRASGAVQRILEYDTQGTAFEYVVPIEMLRQKYELQTVVGLLLMGTTAVMLVVGGIGIMNTMLMTVLRRRPEIGLRLALGARRRDIIEQFVTESALVSALGGVVGLLAGTVIANLVGWRLGWPVEVGLVAGVAGIFAAFAVGVLAGAYPAMQAAAVQPIRTLNHG
ncbi:MAG: ABC transporter permease [Gammaproteobacteria bacterium]